MKNILSNFSWLYKNFKFAISYIIGLIILASLMSMLGVSQALVSKNLIDNATLNNGDKIIMWLSILGFILLSQIAVRCINNILSTYSSVKLKNKLQQKLYTHIIKSKWLELSKYHSVDLLTRASSDSETITNMVTTTIPQIIGLIVMFITSFFALIKLSPSMAFISILIFPLLIFLSKIYGSKQKKFYIILQKLQSKYNSFMQESFSNFLIIKSFNLENKKIDTLNELQKDKLDLSLKKSYIGCVANSLFALSSLLGYFLVFAWGAFKLSDGIIMFGSLTAMIQLFNNIQTPVYGLSSALPQIVSTLGAIERLKEIEHIPLEEELSLDEEIKDFNSLCFNNIYFSYINNSPVLNNVSFSIKKGDIVGIVGPSGGGKTTIIRLLLSLIYARDGLIEIDNKPLNTAHRKLISYVPQGNTLFSGSIEENLKFGNSDAKIDDINKVLKMASAYDFIYKFDNNIKTLLGEKGVGISEGQAQRITIARAFLRRKPILILDEATSSLDPETEVNILKEIKNLDYRPLCIIITHRPSALSICDRVLRLENTSLNEVDNYSFKEIATEKANRNLL